LLPYYYDHFHLDGEAVALQDDPGVLIGDVAILEVLPAATDVVVSLCRVGREDVPTGIEHHEIWLMDEAEPEANPNLEWILTDLADSLCRWRDQDRRVLVHCVRAESRTPTVAAAYLARRFGIGGSEALKRVVAQFPTCNPNPGFAAVLSRLFAAEGDPHA
jgi:protein-tyrosine phosphatase